MNVEEEMASFIFNLKFDDIEEKVIHEVKRRIIDSIGVASASIESPPARAFHRTLNFYKGNAHLIGGGSASADAASFYNSLLIRYLDFNDTYLSREPLHPSDMIGTLLSVGSLFNSDCKSLFTAIAAGYEIGVRLCDSASPRKHGLDHVNFLQIGMAAALSKLLNLDEKQTVNVISITTVPHIALRESRVGDLSMWKAGAAANSSRNATFAALITMNGFTAPATPISGKFGLRNVLLPELDVSSLHNIRKADAILRTYVKKYPVEYHAQAAVDAALKIQSKLNGASISKIEIETYEAGKSILADSEKWTPTNRETADHSLPFIVAAALQTGNFWLDTYSLTGDARLMELMGKVEVVERRDFTESYPGLLPTRVVVHASNGIHQEELSVPRGHSKNPMTDSEVDEKFLMLTKNTKLLEKLHLSDDLRVDQLV
jgi:2-methylcitrate dehydratase